MSTSAQKPASVILFTAAQAFSILREVFLDWNALNVKYTRENARDPLIAYVKYAERNQDSLSDWHWPIVSECRRIMAYQERSPQAVADIAHSGWINFEAQLRQEAHRLIELELENGDLWETTKRQKGKATDATRSENGTGKAKTAEGAARSATNSGTMRLGSKSTTSNRAQAKLQAAFVLHHKYEKGGSIGNSSPISIRRLATIAKTSPSTSKDFFDHWFNGIRNYKSDALNHQTKLRIVLMQIQGESLLGSMQNYGTDPNTKKSYGE